MSPQYALNVVALLNSITEYAYRYGKQDVTTAAGAAAQPTALPSTSTPRPALHRQCRRHLYFTPLSAGNTTIT